MLARAIKIVVLHQPAPAKADHVYVE